NKKLPKRGRDTIEDVFSFVDLDSFRIQKKYTQSISLEEEDGELKPFSTEVGGAVAEEPKDLLSHIIEVLNDSFGGDLTDDDRLNLEKIQTKLEEDEELLKVHESDNSDINKRFVFDKAFDSLLQGLVDESLGFYKKLSDRKRNEYVKRIMFENFLKKVG
ncbi:MAG: type I restriction endonuclease subunit R, partial [Bacteroidetes bacterium]|nr:type I restriction endonuclease subunit R [Bacteroidota bacterium]